MGRMAEDEKEKAPFLSFWGGWGGEGKKGGGCFFCFLLFFLVDGGMTTAL